MFSAGDDFSLGGTIGQPDATVTVMIGGTYELAGGFWYGVPACKTPPQDVVGKPDSGLPVDGDVDLVDFQVFQQCFNGPNRPYGGGAAIAALCKCLDQEPAGGDGDIDLVDFQKFQNCFNGPNRRPAAACGT